MGVGFPNTVFLMKAVLESHGGSCLLRNGPEVVKEAGPREFKGKGSMALEFGSICKMRQQAIPKNT